LEFGVLFDEKWWMVRMDWAKGGERNGWEGYGRRKETGGVWARMAWKRNGQI
jgi:hypothetical protein